MIKKRKSKEIIYIAMIAYTNYSTDPRVKREAEALVENGYQVDFFSLIRTGEPSFEIVNGVNLYHLAQRRYRGNSKFKYILSYVEFFLRVFFKISIFYFKRKYKVVHVNNMPDFIVFAAIIPKLFGARLILDIRDTMPETFSTKFGNNLNSFLTKILLCEERASANFVNSVISVHNPQKDDILVRRHGIKEDKITVVSNFSDSKIFKPKTKSDFYCDIGNNKKFKIMYHGTISERFGFNIILKGLKECRDKIPDLFFLIIGEGDYSEELFKLIKKYKLEDIVEFRNKMIPVEDLPEIISSVDLGIVPYVLSEATEYMLPTKLMEYIAMEKPVLSVKNKAISYYIKEGEIEFYDSKDSKSFAEKLIYLYNNKRRLDEIRKNERKLSKYLSWKNEKDKYILLIKKLVGDYE